MREILFRGIWVHGNKEWIEGDLVRDSEGKPHIVDTKYAVYWGGESIFVCEDECEVIPETVGQYTGLTDKNGKKVFEGDIVKCTDTTYDYSFTAVVIFGNPNGEYNWGFQLKRISGASANTDILLWFDMDDVGACAEVIGNIHDNKELLEVK